MSLNLRINYTPLPSQKPVFDDDSTETILHSAGLGCVSEETLLLTSQGQKKISDIRWPFFVLSHYKGKPYWGLSTSPFCKGIGTLYQVKTQRGEFVAHGSHRFYEEDDKCQYVHDLYSNINQNFPPLLSSSEESFQTIPFLSVRHLMNTAQDCEDGYQSYMSFYGEQLRDALVFSLAESPLMLDALKSFHKSYCASSLLGHVKELKRNRQDQLSCQKHNLDYTHLLVVLAAALEYQDFFSKHLGHISHFPQLEHQFLETLTLHLKDSGLVQDSSNISLSSCEITSVDKESLPRPFYDCHVFFSNSYYSGGGFHHNSGKSYNLCMKILKLSKLNKGHAGGLLCPSYAMFKKDIYPTFQDIFEKSGIPRGKIWEYNSQDKTYTFIWNSKPLYIFTAENEIAGPNLGYGGVNEFSLCPWDRINQFLRRIRTDSPFKQKILAGTPEDKYGWVMDYVNMMNEQEAKTAGKFKIVFGDTSENKHIDQTYAATLEYMLDKKALQVFKQGRIIKISGDLFYYSFDRTKHSYEIKEIPKSAHIYANLDFNVGRMTCTFAHRIGSRIYFFDEFELLGNSDTAQAAQEILKRYGKNVTITIDASGKNRRTSGASDYQILLQSGFAKEQIRFKSVNPRFRERQLLVNGKFDKDEIIVSPKCKVLIKDLEQVEQSKLTFEKIKDKDGRLTHASDTLDYFIDYEFSLYLNRSTSFTQL